MNDKDKLQEIIADNSQKHSSVSWWPKFAFHYSDVQNMVNILSTGKIFSRENATKYKVMKNDNASKQVINMTETDVTKCARFYFRPLTPTQYYNEGFKHPDLRYDSDFYANVPVPIFLLFDLNKLLLIPGIKFSETKQAGYGSNLYGTIKEFSNFDFDKIYSIGGKNYEEEKSYRQAEILYPDSFDIDQCLNSVLCRNSKEKTTLTTLLRKNAPHSYKKYLSKIKVWNENLFENNGLFIKNVIYDEDKLSFTFSDPQNRSYYIHSQMKKNRVDNLKPISAKLQLIWKSQGHEIYRGQKELQIDYKHRNTIIINSIPTYEDADTMEILFYLENALMCLMEQPLDYKIPF